MEKYAGPGTVSFGSATQPATTASFSLPGSYTLLLSADDGTHAVAFDAVTVNVVLATEGTASNNDFVVHFPTLPGRSYQLEESTDLAPASWTTVANNLSGDGSFFHVPVTGALSKGRAFYRVKVLP